MGKCVKKKWKEEKSASRYLSVRSNFNFSSNCWRTFLDERVSRSAPSRIPNSRGDGNQRREKKQKKIEINLISPACLKIRLQQEQRRGGHCSLNFQNFHSFTYRRFLCADLPYWYQTYYSTRCEKSLHKTGWVVDLVQIENEVSFLYTNANCQTQDSKPSTTPSQLILTPSIHTRSHISWSAVSAGRFRAVIQGSATKNAAYGQLTAKTLAEE